jgi:hypothetical protein
MATLHHPEWYDSNSGNNYPFDDLSTMVNSAGRVIASDTLLDAAIYPAGGSLNMYISSVEVRSDQVTIFISDEKVKNLCSCTFSPNAPPNPAKPTVELLIVDKNGRKAGVLVAKQVNLSVFSAWGAGTHQFLASQTRFVAACCYPVPADTVTGFQLDDGNVLYGDVYLVGEDGVVLDCDMVDEWGSDNAVSVIRVNAVGDPLFRRKVCSPGLFDTPRFIRQVVFQHGQQTVIVGPSDRGNVTVMSASMEDPESNLLKPDSVLRIRTTQQGVLFEAVGERLDNF